MFTCPHPYGNSCCKMDHGSSGCDLYVWLHLASGLSNLIWSACIILIIRTNMLPASIHSDIAVFDQVLATMLQLPLSPYQVISSLYPQHTIAWPKTGTQCSSLEDSPSRDSLQSGYKLEHTPCLRAAVT